MLRFIEGEPGAAKLQPQAIELRNLAESCSRQLRGWLDHLQNTDIQGHRHLDEKTKIQYQQKKKTEAFLKQLDEMKQKSRKQLEP